MLPYSCIRLLPNMEALRYGVGVIANSFMNETGSSLSFFLFHALNFQRPAVKMFALL